MKKKLTLAREGKSFAYKQLLLVMKITVFLIIFTVATGLANTGHSQEAKLTVQLKNASLGEILNAIEDNSNYYFMYNNELIDLSKRMDIDVQNKTIDEILTLLFEKNGINYKIYNRQIVLSPIFQKNSNFSLQQQITVSGRVTDSSGASLPGVTVVVKGTTQGIITDVDGNYSLAKVPGDATLLFSFVGMKTQEIAVGGKSIINVEMTEETIGLDEVVAIGYGTVKKQDLTGSVSSIKSEALQERAITTLGEAFAGQLAGVRAQQISGKPGAELNIVIRGYNSISTSNAPLYIIDGIPVDDVTDLNPNDISSIEVLKDASSSAIYGSRGANGVILITTKQGKKGKPTFNFDMYYGIQKVDKTVDVMDRDEFLAYNIWMKDESYRRIGGNLDDAMTSRPGDYQYPDSWLQPETLPDTDWQKAIFRTAPIQSYQLSASGGGEIGTFLISGAFMRQDGVMEETNYQRVNFRLNTTLNIGTHLKLGMNVVPSFAVDNNPDSEGKESAVHRAIMFAPIAALNSNTEEWGYTEGVYSGPNPLENLKEVINKTQNNKVLTNVWGELSINNALSLKSQYGYNYREARNTYFKPANVNNGEATNGSSFAKNWYSWSLQNTLNYSPKISDTFNMNLLLGQSIEGSKYYYIYAEGNGYPNDLVYTLNVTSNPTDISTSESQNSLASFFGRLNFSAKDKYLLTVNVRRDGSSRFGNDTKWGWFPSASVGWKIDRENFMQQLDWLNLLKLRVSLGKSGNNNIGDYASIASLGTSNYNLSGTIVSGLSPSSSGNPDLGWETQVSKTIGIDFSAFNSRVQANLDYYINDTKDMLLEVPVTYISGYSSMIQNIGKVQNKGWEFEITSHNIKGTFNWSTTFNLSKNSNEVKKLGEDDSPMIESLWKYNAFITKVGEPIGSYYMYKTDGILTEDDFDGNGNALVPIASGQEEGNVKIVDLYEDGKIDSNDLTVIGNNEPDFIWGLNNRFSYKGFDLNILIQGAQGGKVFFAGARQMDVGVSGTNQYSRWVRCWKPEYSESDNPLPETTVDLSWDGKTPNPYGNNPRYNDTWVYDATFIRIKNITVGYNLPKDLCRRFGIDNVRIYVMGDNIYTRNDYPGVSTETNSYGDDIVTEPGVDYGTYPLTKKYSLGINVTF